VWSAGSDGGNRADIYLSNSDVALVNAAEMLWRHECGTLAIGLELLEARLREEGAPRHVRIWLGAALCRPVRLRTIAGVRSRKESLQLAEMSAVAQSGLTQPCRVTIDVTNGSDDAVAVVVEQGVLTAIERVLAAVRVRASNIKPWWAEALAAALRSNPSLRALGIWEGQALTLLMGESRGFSAARALYPVESAEAASAAFARTLVSAMIAPGDALAVSLDWAAATPAADCMPPDEDAVFTSWIRRLGEAP